MTGKKFRYSDFQRLVNKGAVTFQDVQGQKIEKPDLDKIRPDEKISFDLTYLASESHSVGPVNMPSHQNVPANLNVKLAVNPNADHQNIEVAALSDQLADHITMSAQQIELDQLNAQLRNLESAQVKDNDAIEANMQEISGLTQNINDLQAKLDSHETSPSTGAGEPCTGSAEACAAATAGSNTTALAYLDSQIQSMQEMSQRHIKKTFPVHGIVMGSYNKQDVSLPIVSGQGNSFSITVDYPGQNIVNLTRMAQGFAHFGAQSTMNQGLGPLFAGQIVAQLRNYVVMNPTRHQDVRYDARMSVKKGILETFTVHVVPIVSFDQNGKRVTKHLYSVGLVDTVEAAMGKLDKKLLGGKGFLGNPQKTFVSQNLGYQLEVKDYHQAFEYATAMNKDPNVTMVQVYELQDTQTRYRQNKHNGWDVIKDATQPLDSGNDYYSATVNGFMLRYDPVTKTMSGQLIYTAPTFVTDQFAHILAEAQPGQKLTGNEYLTTPLIEHKLSIADLKMERILLEGKDEQGNKILGVLRNSISGRIERFITDPRDLNTMDSMADSKGHKVDLLLLTKT